MLIRTIKPEFWTDEKIVALSIPARLLFIGLWNLVDNDGRCWWEPRTIKWKLFPADPMPIPDLVQEMTEQELVTIYTADGKECLQVNNFRKHQKVDPRYAASKIPGIPVLSPVSHRIPPQGVEVDVECNGSGVGVEVAPAPEAVVTSEREKEPDETDKVLIAAMERELLDTSTKAVREWRILCRKAGVKSYEEGSAFVAFAVHQGRANGVQVGYARQVVDLAPAWRDWGRERWQKRNGGGE